VVLKMPVIADSAPGRSRAAAAGPETLRGSAGALGECEGVSQHADSDAADAQDPIRPRPRSTPCVTELTSPPARWRVGYDSKSRV